MSAKHTPGPWSYSHSSLSYFELVADDVLIVSGCGCCGSPSVSSEEDARLIAAAPELLAAARQAESLMCDLDHNGTMSDVVEQLRAAIAKTEGAQ